MTNVNAAYGVSDPTHDLSLSDGSLTYGMIFAGGPRVLSEIPLSPPAQQFENEQRNWIGGRGRNRFDEDNTGFADGFSLWSTSDEKLMPSLQWRFARGIRTNEDTSLPQDNQTLAWWKLYGNDPSNKIARYLSIAFVASGTYSADKGFEIIRRRGTPGTLTFELCANSSGSPGTVLKTVTKTTSDITDTISVYQVFDWTTTESLSSGTTYHVKIYGASGDTAANHWEVLTNGGGSSSKYSTDNSAWTGASVSLYYRIIDAGTVRQWRYFTLEGALYAVSQNADGSSSVLRTNGVRGTATAATSTTLTCSALSMTTNQYAGALIRIFDGVGDGQIRAIVSNTSTQFTVATWDVTPDTTSRFVVYGTDYWTTTTGTSGLGAITDKPAVAGAIAYFPQGNGTAMRRMRVNASSHDFAADSTNVARAVFVHTEGVTPQVISADKNLSTIKLANTVSWGTDLTFSAAKNIGTSEFRITNAITHNKTLHIFKEDGLYTYRDGFVERLGANFQDVPDPTTGLGVGAQNNVLWFGWGHSVERMIGSSVDDMMNFKRGYQGIPDDRKGYVSCIVSAVGWLFFVIDGGEANYSSIIAWNGFGWHEVFRTWAQGVRIRNACWQPCIESRPRLWFDVNGEMAYIEFPKYAANPLRDSGINYAWEGVIVTSTYDAHDQNLYKILQTLRVFTEAGSAEIDYQTNANVGTTNWTVLGTADSQPVEDLDLNLGGVFQVRFRLRLQTATTRTAPVVTGWQLSGRVMSLSKYQFICTFRADSDATTYTDEPDHNPDTLYGQIKTWAETQTRLTMRSTSQSADNKTVSVTLPSKSVDWIDTGESKWGGRISFAILET